MLLENSPRSFLILVTVLVTQNESSFSAASSAAAAASGKEKFEYLIKFQKPALTSSKACC
jgi:hypothetical protein